MHNRVHGLLYTSIKDSHSQLTSACRCSKDEVAKIATGAPMSPDALCPGPTTSMPAAGPPTGSSSGQHAACAQTVRQALERALLETFRAFWNELRVPRKLQGRQCNIRRNRAAMQVFLRLHILIAFKGTPHHRCNSYTVTV